MEKNKARVHVLGEDFLISTDKSEEYINRVIEHLRKKIEKIHEMTGGQSPLRTAILAGLLLSEEVLDAPAPPAQQPRVKPENEQEEEIAAIASRLINDLDGII